MAEIALELERALSQRTLSGAPGTASGRTLASGAGWSVSDILCTSGPQDRPFEEHHADVSIAIVTAGSFQYRSNSGRSLMTPGSLLLGNPGHGFECSHEHGAGDRCLSFHYDPDFFEQLAREAGAGRGRVSFPAVRIPPIREFSPLTGHALAALTGPTQTPWEEIAILVAEQTVKVIRGNRSNSVSTPPSSLARITRAVRAIESHAEQGLSLGMLAREAGLSPYHFLRLFERLTGITPHQYLRRHRLREAARTLLRGHEQILDLALDCGFGDVSNFNRAFRAEFGLSPRAYRQRRIAA